MIDFKTIKKLTIGGVELKQLFIDGVQVWKSGYKNWVKYSLESGGAAVYNGGLGYKTGYRVRSGGAEGAASNCICTGFIPFKVGDILRIKPIFTGQNSANTINFADASFTNLGQYNDSGALYGICADADQAKWKTICTEANGVTTVDISGPGSSGNVAYVRITHLYYPTGTTAYTAFVNNPEKDFIITVNEEIA